MDQLSLQFDNDVPEFEPGETISVRVGWDFPEAPDSMELRAIWNTVGKGTKDVGIERVIEIDSPNASDSRVIELELPAAPYSFSGKLVSLVWALELVALPTKKARRIEFTMAPGGTEVLLGTVSR